MHSKKKLIELLIKVEGVKTFEDMNLGTLVKMNSRLAYRFALCTQSYYSTAQYNALYIKKMLATFNHRNYLLEDGLFEIDNKTKEIKNILTNSFIKKNKNLFKGDKYIIILEKSFNSEDLKNFFNKITHIGFKPENYIISFASPTGSDWEQFYEFIISEYFLKHGYITDTQVPWDRQGSTPDASIIKHSLTKILGNFMLTELSFIKYFLKEKINLDLVNEYLYELLEIIEVKTFNKKSQFNKYKKLGISNYGFELLVNANSSNKKMDNGLIYFENNLPVIIKGNKFDLDPKKSESDKQWFNIYLKMHLLGNLNIDEIIQILKIYTSFKILTSETIIVLAKQISFKEIFRRINYGL